MSQKEIISYLKEQPIRISVFGEFGSGKTTFINALIGEAILSRFLMNQYKRFKPN